MQTEDGNPSGPKEKNGFAGVVFGLSGGIDSALCAAIAVDALGAHRVRAVMLPYRYTAQVSIDDAAQVARALAIQYDVVSIAPAIEGLEVALASTFTGLPRDVTEEPERAAPPGPPAVAAAATAERHQ